MLDSAPKGTRLRAVRLQQGDIVVFPHGDPHVVSSAPGMRAKASLDIPNNVEEGNGMPFLLRTGGDGPSDASLICGFFSCDARPFNPLLDALPRFMRFGRDATTSHHLLNHFIRCATTEMGDKRAGRPLASCWAKSSWRMFVRAGMEEVLIEQTLSRTTLPAYQSRRDL
jgi:hypothetical protein